MSLKYSVLILALLGVHLAISQSSTDGLLQVDEYYDLVKEYHPVAKQAELVASRARLAVMGARGAFDPKLVSNFANKQFEDKRYYDTWNTYLHLPTQFNIDLKVGLERNNGLFLNPENNVPSEGLYYAGLSVPLGQGLLANTRNIALKKSKIEGMSFENQARIVLNNLLLDANNTYWIWYEAYQKQQLAVSNYQLISERYEGIRQAVINGDIAGIDSTETLIQVQQWSNNLNKATLEYGNSGLLLQNFIWSDSLVLEALPVTDISINALLLLDEYLEIAARHPELESIRLKNSTLALDRRLSSDQLKPKLDVNYNVLLSEKNSFENQAFLENNYKAGFDFSFPLLLRKERAKLKMVDVKQQENQLKLNYKSRQIENKVRQYYNKCLTLAQMLVQQEEIQRNYQLMLDAEQIKFENGESSIFLINSRENKLLGAAIKLIELKSDYGNATGQLEWAAGLFVID
jgi:outer membrane protein TolC